jgi:hypothetical protein
MKLNIPKINVGRNINKMLKNKTVLYIVLFIAVMNTLGYLMVNNIDAVILLFLVGLLTSYFSKNMIVVMLVAILFTNLLVGSKQASRTPLLEGMDHDGKDDDEADKKGDDKVEEKVSEECDENEEMGDDGKCHPKKSGYTNLKPARIDETDDSSELDYSGSLEAAYDNLDKLLSSDAIQKMSADTQNLAEKQKKLMGNIDKLEPMIKNAEDMMNQLDSSKLTSIMDKFMKMNRKK